ncbi:MAG: hypothetical protein ACI8TQ_004113, partial [Planctomycetota bacterium]
MKNSNSAAAFTLCLFVPATHSAQQPQTSLRLVELNGDMQKDRLINRADGAIEISLGMGLRQFELISQVMPKAHVIDLVAEDLNGDGITDLYLLTNHTNIALLGDGTGLFREATLELGLQDEGVGIGIELDDVDNDGIADLLLHNQTSDVLFWGIPGGFERDEATPFVSMSLPSSEVNVALPYKEQKNGLRGTVNSAPFDAQPTSNGSVHLPGSSRTPVSGSSNSSATPTILPSIASLPPRHLHFSQIPTQIADWAEFDAIEDIEPLQHRRAARWTRRNRKNDSHERRQPPDRQRHWRDQRRYRQSDFTRRCNQQRRQSDHWLQRTG